VRPLICCSSHYHTRQSKLLSANSLYPTASACLCGSITPGILPSLSRLVHTGYSLHVVPVLPVLCCPMSPGAPIHGQPALTQPLTHVASEHNVMHLHFAPPTFCCVLPVCCLQALVIAGLNVTSWTTSSRPAPGPVAASLPKTDNILLVLCRSVLASWVMKCGRPWLRLEKGSGPPSLITASCLVIALHCEFFLLHEDTHFELPL